MLYWKKIIREVGLDYYHDWQFNPGQEGMEGEKGENEPAEGEGAEQEGEPDEEKIDYL